MLQHDNNKYPNEYLAFNSFAIYIWSFNQITKNTQNVEYKQYYMCE